MRPDRVAASDWYALMLAGRCTSLPALLRDRFGARLAAIADRLPPLRGLLLHRATRDFELLALVRNEPGAGTLLVLEALRRGPPRLVFLEFIGAPQPRTAAGRLRARLRGLAEGPALRRAMVFAHVLTAWEAEVYAERLGLPAERFRTIRWPLVRDAEARPGPPATAGRRVVSSGRAYCDWETLFTAAAGRDWDLLAICGRRDLDRVRELSAEVGAEVRCEIPRADHDRALAESRVYALCLDERAVSAGQVRLAAAVGAGVPVVASRVAAIDGYASEETALLVPPSDPAALGAAVDRLLGDPRAALRLRDAAFRQAANWTYREYFAAIAELIEDGLESSRLGIIEP